MRTSIPVLLTAGLFAGACGGGASSTSSNISPSGSDAGQSLSADAAMTEAPAPTGTSDGPGSTTTDDAGRTLCETLEAVARPRIPEVLIVLDRSGSMADNAGWDHAIVALDHLMTAFPSFEFGLSLYPAIGEELDCKPGKVNVSPMMGTTTSIHGVLFDNKARAISGNGYTPTSSTLLAAKSALALKPDDARERFVLLVTDGQPNCNAAGPQKFTPDVDATLAALDALRGDGVNTFVIGYQTKDVATVMDQMAMHGGTEHHYPVEDEATFSNAFGKIAGSLAPCSFELEKDAPGLEYIRVLLDGSDLQLGPSGFTVEGTRTITLGDAACKAVRDGNTHGIKVLVECEPVRVI